MLIILSQDKSHITDRFSLFINVFEGLVPYQWHNYWCIEQAACHQSNTLVLHSSLPSNHNLAVVLLRTTDRWAGSWSPLLGKINRSSQWLVTSGFKFGAAQICLGFQVKSFLKLFLIWGIVALATKISDHFSIGVNISFRCKAGGIWLTSFPFFLPGCLSQLSPTFKVRHLRISEKGLQGTTRLHTKQYWRQWLLL